MICLASPQSTINFPSSSPAASSSNAHVHPRTPHLPFRRISLPASTSFQRLSVASVASFDSLSEEGGDSGNGCQHKSSLLSASHLAVSTTAAEDVRRRSIVTPTKGVCRHRGRHKKKYSSEAASALIARSPSKLRVAREARQHKRRKIIREFFDTEKTYVDGLDFIYHNFLSPLIASLETPEPLLDRTCLTKLFSNFIDIWNLHKAFFDALTQHLSPMLTPESANSPQPDATQAPPPPLSSILLSHFPYLSLYTPFITAFPSILSTLVSLTTPPSFSHPNPNYSKPFSDFLVKHEAHPQCGKLKFRDWMLTIVQRCPRYLLLLKDLRGCTEPVDEQGSEEGEEREDGEIEYNKLGRVLDLVSKITSSLNTSLQIHAQTLSLISLQRSTSNLPLSPPFQFILPGRSLLKRGPLYQIERSEPPREREFLLFSDCLAWLAKKGTAGEETLGEWGWARGRISSRFIGSSESVSDAAMTESSSAVYGNRNRSMSDAHLPLSSPWRDNNNEDGSRSTPSSPRRARFPSSQVNVPMPTAAKPNPKRHSMAGVPVTSASGNEVGMEERWVYKGRLDLVDLEVVVSSEWGVEQRRFEILSTEGSFALYAATEDDRDYWVDMIRQAKAQWLVSLNVTHPNSTLTSSASTNHVRKSLQALPFPPSASASLKGGDADAQRKRVEHVGGRPATRRSKVEHWVPAIWIPNERTKQCMRCGQAFGWRRRRHHCRLCGRCVCAGCSEKTFYITDTNIEASRDGASKPARACNVCYETVFPVLDSETEPEGSERADSSSNSSPNAEVGPVSDTHAHNWDTITSLSNFSDWLSAPSFSVLPGSAESSSSALMPLTPKALMGIDFERFSGMKLGDRPFGDGNGKGGRVRLRSLGKNANSTRPLSTFQVFKVFSEDASVNGNEEKHTQLQISSEESVRRDDEEVPEGKQQPLKPVESTVKERKRFSLPAIAIQPLNVTARTVAIGSNGGRPRATEGSSALGSNGGPANGTEGERSRRFSLISGGPFPRSRLSLGLDSNEESGGGDVVEGRQAGAGEKSIVMGKLSELLRGSR
ncbi:hypothetical protein APHAL10511_005754 [Amanita phalloides]|nr:hypothetical protein APHAL10511_005754 [Amanita phalloides]